MSTLLQSDTIHEMDEKIINYAKFLETVSDKEKPYLQSKLLSAKLMREKLVAMTAFAKAQLLIAEMEVLIAENNLKNACEQLDKSIHELDEKKEKTKSHKSKDSKSHTNREKKSDKENTKSSKSDTDKSESKDRRESKKRRYSDSNHSNSKKSKKSKSSNKDTKPKTLVEATNFDRQMKTDNLSIIGTDEDTVLIENLTPKNISRVQSQDKTLPKSSIKIMFEDDVFKDVKMEALNDLNTSTDDLVNNLFKDILNAKMKVMSNGSTSNSSTLCKSMLREMLEQC